MNGAEVTDAGIVYEKLDRSERFFCSCDERADFFRAGYVCRDGEHFHALIPQADCGVFELLRVACTDRNFRSHLAKSSSNGKTDSTASARQQGRFSCENSRSIHKSLRRGDKNASIHHLIIGASASRQG